MDREEYFFKENRLRLDTEDLDLTRWERIVEPIKRHERYKALKQIFMAAGFAGLVFIGGFWFVLQSGRTGIRQQTGIFHEIAHDMVEDENDYIRQIDMTMNIIRKQTVPSDYAYLFKDFIQQLQIIDKQYEMYKTEVGQHGYSQELIQQIMYNYQLKLSVLQSLHTEIAKINQLSKVSKNESEKIQLEI